MVGALVAPSHVALLAEGVDRNSEKVKEFFGFQKSPSSRRAWIEIRTRQEPPATTLLVALLTEGVDRN